MLSEFETKQIGDWLNDIENVRSLSSEEQMELAQANKEICDAQLQLEEACRTVFQSTFPRGERPPCSEESNRSAEFQSTFPRGERHRDAFRRYRPNDFNPRSLVGNDGKFSQIFFVFLCNKYNFSTFYYPFSLFFSVIHVTFLIFVVRILPAFYVYF